MRRWSSLSRKRHGRMNWARSDQPAWGLFRGRTLRGTVRTPDGRPGDVGLADFRGVGGIPLLNRTVQSLPGN